MLSAEELNKAEINLSEKCKVDRKVGDWRISLLAAKGKDATFCTIHYKNIAKVNALIDLTFEKTKQIVELILN